ANPEHYGFQKYTPLSEMDGFIVDIRNLANVSKSGVITAEVPWGRLTPKSGNGLVNIAAEGRESALLVDKNDKCHYLIREIFRERFKQVLNQ
ncbi:MAG: hypothetical protein H7333_09410, partial [Bdellovibrionales bacterium]|nr:hypothetical protein [Oligoflexia bacterium]